MPSEPSGASGASSSSATSATSATSGVIGVIGALTVAVWGRAAAPDRLLDDGDRVEIVRPLKVDPKEARRLRYEVQGDRGRVRRKVGSLKP
jgi:putative ubiquitin-RnfH superfamily antitoxin RatB of RatAB toxin-antitoxin module